MTQRRFFQFEFRALDPPKWAEFEDNFDVEDYRPEASIELVSSFESADPNDLRVYLSKGLNELSELEDLVRTLKGQLDDVLDEARKKFAEATARVEIAEARNRNRNRKD